MSNYLQTSTWTEYFLLLYHFWRSNMSFWDALLSIQLFIKTFMFKEWNIFRSIPNTHVAAISLKWLFVTNSWKAILSKDKTIKRTPFHSDSVIQCRGTCLISHSKMVIVCSSHPTKETFQVTPFVFSFIVCYFV